jgi:tetratricopeptide (TPR) repeat protein
LSWAARRPLPGVQPTDPAALAWARKALAEGCAQLPDTLPFAAETLAWAIKDACNEAWGSAPVQVPVGVELLRQLNVREPGPVYEALLAWMQGLALIREGALDAALQRLADVGAMFKGLDRPLSAAQTLVPRMVALGMLGRLDEALALGGEAVQRFLALGDDLSAGKVELNLGTLLGRADRHMETVPLLRRAAVRFSRAGQLGLSVGTDIALANALIWLHQFDEAKRVSSRALMRAKTHGQTVNIAAASGAIGRLELMRGHYQVALGALVDACRLHEQAGSAPQLSIDAESTLADGYLSVNLLPEAERLFGVVIDRARQYRASVEEAIACLQRANVRARMGKAGAAEQDLEAARILFAQQNNAVGVAQTEIVRARIFLGKGQPEQALALAGRACQALADSSVTPLRLEGQALLASAYAAAGDAQHALQGYRTTLEQAATLAPVRLTCHLGLAELALAAGDTAATASELAAVMALAGREQSAMFSDEARMAVWQSAERAQELMLQLQLHVGADSFGLAACIEEGRGRVMADGSTATGAAGTHQDALASLRWAQQNYRQALAAGDGPAAGRHAAEVAALEQALLEARRRDQLAQPARREPETLDSGTALVQRSLERLSSDTAIVSWQELEHGGRPLLVACVLRQGQVLHQCLSAPQWHKRLQALRFQIDALRFGAPVAGLAATEALRRTTAHLQALHELIWKPIEPLLQGAERIVLVPHRSLHYLPFAALHDGQRSVGERYEFSGVPSLRLWLALQQAPAVQGVNSRRSALLVGHGGQHLPHVRPELQSVGALFGKGATVLDGSRATSSAMRQALANAPVDVLHLACHGQFRADSPSFSNLELADGPLTLMDAHELPLQGALVTLSACDTGQSAQAPGNELVGLVRGFLAAGARTVVSTLWTVDDQSTAELMRHFYQRLLAGQRPAAALRDAQRQLAQERPHPFYWAAFTVSGAG